METRRGRGVRAATPSRFELSCGDASAPMPSRSPRSGWSGSGSQTSAAPLVALLPVVESVTLDLGVCSLVPVISPPDSAATATLPIDSQRHSRQVKSGRPFPALA